MAQTDLDVCNRAIGRVGGEALESFDDETPLAAFCAQNWPAKRAWLLSKYRWVFAERIAQLTQLATAPAGCPLPYAFQRPADLGGAIHAVRDGQDIRTARAVRILQLADYIAAECLPAWAEYTGGADPATWPPWFEELAVTAFGVDLARRMLRRPLADTLQVEAFGTPEMLGQGGLFLAAMQEDARNAPKRELCYRNGGDLVAARFGVGVLGGGFGGEFGGAWPNNGFPFIVTVNG